MFVTMPCLSESSMLSPCKEINDAATEYSLLLTTNLESLSSEINTRNYHQSLAMIWCEKWLDINPMSLSATLAYYKNQYYFRIYSYPQKIGTGLTQRDLVPLDVGQWLADMWNWCRIMGTSLVEAWYDGSIQKGVVVVKDTGLLKWIKNGSDRDAGGGLYWQRR